MFALHQPAFSTCSKKILAEEESTVFEASKLIKKLLTFLLFANMHRQIHLKPKQKNNKRWSLTYQMLLSYVQIRKKLPNFNVVNIDALLLSPALERKVEVFCKVLDDLDEVRKRLEWPDASIRSEHAYFDTVFKGYMAYHTNCTLMLRLYEIHILRLSS